MTRPYHHGNLRAALVQAGSELLREQGYGALSLRAVAARAQVSHSAPYNHFADRRALLSAIAADAFRQLLEDLRAAPAGPPDEALAEMGRAYLRFAREQPSSYRLMFASDILVGNPDPEIGATSMATYRHVQERVAGVCGATMAGPVATVIWSQLHGFALLAQEDRIRPWMRGETGIAELEEALLATLPGAARSGAAALARPIPPPVGAAGTGRR